MSSQPAALGQAAVDLGQAAVDLRQAADDAARIIQSISHEGDLSNASTAFSAVFARVQEDYRPSFIAEHILWFIVVNWDRFAKPDRVRWLVQQISSNERIDGDKWMPALDYCIARIGGMNDETEVKPTQGAGIDKDCLLVNAHSIAAQVLWDDNLLSSDRFFFDALVTAFETEDPAFEIGYRLDKVKTWLEDKRAADFRSRVKNGRTTPRDHPCGSIYAFMMFGYIPEGVTNLPVDANRWNWWCDRYAALAQELAQDGLPEFIEPSRRLAKIHTN